MTGTVLVVVTTNPADSTAIASWLGPQLPDGTVARATGYYAAMTALDRRPRALIADIGVPDGREDWRLAELRNRTDAPFLVVTDATHLPMLAGATHADLAVTDAAHLPPLRELLLTDEPVVRDQTVRDQAVRRRSSR